MRKIVKLLSFLNVTQEIVNESGFTRRRLNPYNPLSYIIYIIIVLLFGLKLFITSIVSALSFNPFKYYN
jgi:uncharacterized membrane protein YccF (DUF307 family)